MMHLAFYTFTLLRKPLGKSEEFLSYYTAVDQQLQVTPGVIDWAKPPNGFSSDSIDWGKWGIITYPNIYKGPVTVKETYLIQSLSLWESLESVFSFSYRSTHLQAIQSRKDWTLKHGRPRYIAWWVKSEHIPTWREACERYDLYLHLGSNARAFDFKQPYDHLGNHIEIDRNQAWELKSTCDQEPVGSEGIENQ